MTNSQLFYVEKLTYRYQHRPILQRLNFSLSPGEGLLVQGENGSGKSTLLKILAGLVVPDSGTLIWQGQSMMDDKSKFKQNMSFLGHKNGLKEDLTIFENLKFSLQLHNLNLPEKMNTVLELLDLQHRQHDLVRSLSFGQKRKTALARLIMMQKSLWLLDEPFVGLDQNSASYFKQEIIRHIESCGIVVLTHHGDLHIKIPLKQLNLVVH